MQPAAYGILDPGIVVRIHGGERRACQRRPQAVRTCHCVRERWRTRRGPLLLVGDSASTPPIPRWCNGSTPVFGTVRRGSNPRRGAKPDHRKSDDSAFPHGNRFFPLSHLLIRSMRNARGPSTGFPTFPVAPEMQGIRRPPCSRGNGRHRRLNQPALALGNASNRVRLPQSPLIGYEQSGTDTCRRRT